MLLITYNQNKSTEKILWVVNWREIRTNINCTICIDLWKNYTAHSYKEDPVEISKDNYRIDEEQTTIMHYVESAQNLTNVKVILCDILVDSYQKSRLQIGKKEAKHKSWDYE